MFRWFRRLRKLWWAYKGRCPHCGEELIQKNRRLTQPTGTGRIQRVFRQCPHAHFAIEYVTRNRVVVHDENGEQIDLLFHRDLRLLKSENESTGSNRNP